MQNFRSSKRVARHEASSPRRRRERNVSVGWQKIIQPVFAGTARNKGVALLTLGALVCMPTFGAIAYAADPDNENKPLKVLSGYFYLDNYQFPYSLHSAESNLLNSRLYCISYGKAGLSDSVIGNNTFKPYLRQTPVPDNSLTLSDSRQFGYLLRKYLKTEDAEIDAAIGLLAHWNFQDTMTEDEVIEFRKKLLDPKFFKNQHTPYKMAVKLAAEAKEKAPLGASELNVTKYDDVVGVGNYFPRTERAGKPEVLDGEIIVNEIFTNSPNKRQVFKIRRSKLNAFLLTPLRAGTGKITVRWKIPKNDIVGFSSKHSHQKMIGFVETGAEWVENSITVDVPEEMVKNADIYRDIPFKDTTPPEDCDPKNTDTGCDCNELVKKSELNEWLINKADKSFVDAALSKKADRSELAGKADRGELAGKADRGELAGKADRGELAGKADKSELAGKADKSYVDGELGKKADKSALTNSGPSASGTVDKNYIDAALAGKADKADLAGKADKSELAGKADKSELAGKADKSELAGKADKTDLAGKADKSEVAGKADKSEVAGKADKSELAGKADKADLAGKADKAAVENALAGKADKAELDKKADKLSVEEIFKTKTDLGLLARKADKEYVDGELAKKADKAAVENALAGKADKADLAGKADKADLAGKADKAAVENALAGKADKSELAGKADKSDLAGEGDKVELGKKANNNNVAAKPAAATENQADQNGPQGGQAGDANQGQGSAVNGEVTAGNGSKGASSLNTNSNKANREEQARYTENAALSKSLDDEALTPEVEAAVKRQIDHSRTNKLTAKNFLANTGSISGLFLTFGAICAFTGLGLIVRKPRHHR